MIRQISAGQANAGSLCVPLGRVGVATPTERRERHDAGVEPAVPDLRDALRDLATIRANANVVDPRSMQFLQIIDRINRSLTQLLDRADHRNLTRRREIKR